jgi:putative glycosyltransferase (TIGR04372 family)
MMSFLQVQLALITNALPMFIRHLKSGNWEAILYFNNKALWKIWNLLFFPFGMVLVLIMRSIRPFVLIRISVLVSERIGHFAGNTELYLCERDEGINVPEGRHIDLWYHNWPISNKQLACMWNRVLYVGPRWLLSSVKVVNDLIPGGEVHQIGNNTRTDIDVYNLIDKLPPHLIFLSEEEKKGITGLRTLGIPEGAPFVCLIVRDSSYLEKSVPWKSWGYHDYRDCDIQNYLLVAQKLVEKGYYVVRMGAVVNEPMNVNHPMIIDYATNGMRSDFMDIYLAARCSFCIVGNSGFEAVPYIFRRPIVYVDYVPLGMVRWESTRLISITKKYWFRDESRFLTLREILESDIGFFWDSLNYEEKGIELIESTPEEIAAVGLEMDERLKGSWQTTIEDEELQRQFWEMFPKGKYHGEIYSYIGAHFLRQHNERSD